MDSDRPRTTIVLFPSAPSAPLRRLLLLLTPSLSCATGDFIEVDITLSYAFPSEGSFSAEVGLIEYLFPAADEGFFGVPSTTEIYVSLGRNVPLSPTLGLYYDFDQVEDSYADFGVTWSRENATDNGSHNRLVTVGVSRARADKWAIGGYLAYSDSLDKKVLPTQPVDFFAGFSLSRAF